MPCNTVTTQSVALAKAITNIMENSLKRLGWSIVSISPTEIQARRAYSEMIVWRAGKGLEVRSPNAQPIITQVTKEYSKQAVTWAAKRAGWTVQQTTDNKLTISRR